MFLIPSVLPTSYLIIHFMLHLRVSREHSNVNHKVKAILFFLLSPINSKVLTNCYCNHYPHQIKGYKVYPLWTPIHSPLISNKIQFPYIISNTLSHIVIVCQVAYALLIIKGNFYIAAQWALIHKQLGLVH